MSIKQVTISDETITNSQAINAAFKRFAVKHGLTTDEVGRQESRTMDYKTNFPYKKRRIREARKKYGDPKKWVKWANSQVGLGLQIKTQVAKRLWKMS
tara:strand:- start:1733 stop:2026 length:294 start_codon:yes stop_codon:yes gene_type:complete